MAIKDYYKILELSPSATITEVKKNFRRLALRYHPDTNQGNRYAEAWYREIQEAYETLTDTNLREAYLQERWLMKSQGRSFVTTMAITPTFVLHQANELLKEVKNMDHFRMSQVALQRQILMVLEDEKLDLLSSFNDKDINREIGGLILSCMFPLEHVLTKPIIQQLNKLATYDPVLQHQVKSYYKKSSRQYRWNKYQDLLIFLMTILLCGAIYFLSRKN
ncbi:MAG: DnaJ domain-containing protein [Bacteroidota bacterium]